MARLPLLLCLALVAGDEAKLLDTVNSDMEPPSAEINGVVETLRKQLMQGNQDYDPVEKRTDREHDAGTSWKNPRTGEQHGETDRDVKKGNRVESGYAAYRYVPTMRSATALDSILREPTAEEQKTTQSKGRQKAVGHRTRNEKESKRQMRSKDSSETKTKQPVDPESELKKAMKKAEMRIMSPVTNPEAFANPSLSKYLRNKLWHENLLRHKSLDEPNGQQEIDGPIFEDSQQEVTQMNENPRQKAPLHEELQQKIFQQEDSLQETLKEAGSQEDKSLKSASREKSQKLDLHLNNFNHQLKNQQRHPLNIKSTQKAGRLPDGSNYDSADGSHHQHFSDDELGIPIPHRRLNFGQKDVAETQFGNGRTSHHEFSHLRSIIDRSDAATSAVNEPVSFEKTKATQRDFTKTVIIRNIPQRSIEHVIEKVSNCIKRLDKYTPRGHRTITNDASTSRKRRKRSPLRFGRRANEPKRRVDRKVLTYKLKKQDAEIQYGYPMDKPAIKKPQQQTTTRPRTTEANRTSTRKAPARTERPFLTLFHSLKSFKTDKQYMMFPTYNSSHIDLLKEIVLNHESGYPPFQPGAPYIPDLPFHPMEETTYNIDIQFNSPYAESTTVHVEVYPSEVPDPFRGASKQQAPSMQEVAGMPNPRPKLDWVVTENLIM